ncbi:MAG: PEP-CTERM sorting domain-containing protein [Gammaproteobacteria bacterium]|nr:PEP-CTERM sorting domain-containing protein [Gammaproteobacteria bacterium]
MNHITKTLAGMALGCCMTSGGVHAASIQSLTIEEIGVTSGGLGTSGLANGGGWGNYFSIDGTYMAPPAFFTSNGTDGALIMGTTQANGAFSTGFNWGGSNHFEFNTLKSAPSGTITGGAMTLNLSGLVAEFTLGHTAFPAAPDASTLVTSVSMIDANRYFYTADWTHVFNNDVYDLNTLAVQPSWNGSGAVLHFEGIATMAPVPEAETYIMMLAGLSLVGLMAHRRRKRV